MPDPVESPTEGAGVLALRRVAILGVGLLGGSVGLALRKALPEIEVVGTSRNASRRQRAIDCGAVTEATDSIESACRDCDVVVVASPVDRIAAMTIDAAKYSPDECLITDVGSTKAGIVSAVAADEHAAGKFVAAHPIAGSEKTGVENATADLFENKCVIVTPSDNTPEANTVRCVHFWKLTGGRTLLMSPDEHDTHLASVSHVPHLVSSLVARMTSVETLPLTGSGWRDITRVAAGDPTLWAAICQENRTAISQQLGQLATRVAELREMIDDQRDDDLLRWLQEAKNLKDQA